MKNQIIPLIASIFWVFPAFAGTQVMFNKDTTQATVLMLAFTSNPDAVAFNDVMNVPVEDMNGKAAKRMAFYEDSGEKSLDAMCAFSKLVTSTGSCTLVFHIEGKAVLDPSSKTISYKLTGPEAARLAAFFILPLASGEVFHSSDNQLLIAVEYSQGGVSAFQIKYGGSAL